MNYHRLSHTDFAPMVSRRTAPTIGDGGVDAARQPPRQAEHVRSPDRRTPETSGFLSRHWPAAASLVLHGLALALLLLELGPAVPTPPVVEAPIIPIVFAPPARTAQPMDAEVRQADPQPAAPATTAEDSSPEAGASGSVEPVAAMADSEAEPDVMPVAEPEIAAPTPPPPKAQPQPKPQAKTAEAAPKPQARPSTEPRPPSAEDTPSTTPSSSSPPSPAPAAPPQAASAPAPEGPPPDYVRLVIQQIERHKVYPRTAQQRRQQGRILLRVAIDRAGRVLSYAIEQGSGHEILDREAAAMIQRASPLPPIPARLAGDRLELVLPVDFFLR
jgi:protein TonB